MSFRKSCCCSNESKAFFISGLSYMIANGNFIRFVYVYNVEEYNNKGVYN